jgi:hypothetical protein
MHHVPYLHYHPILEEYTRRRVADMARTDIFEHPSDLPHGENLYWMSGKVPFCQDALDAWYEEEKKKKKITITQSSASRLGTLLKWFGRTAIGLDVHLLHPRELEEPS